jgi:integrase
VERAFGEACEAYICHLHTLGLKDAGAVEASLRREFMGQRRRRQRAFGKREWKSEWHDTADPAWRGRELSRVNRIAVRERLQAIAKRNVWAARNALYAMSRMFNWVRDEEMWGVEHSPIEGIRAAQFGVTKRIMRRKRVLTNDELKAVWRVAGSMGVFGQLVRVLMLTGQRRSDFAKAKRSELLMDEGLRLLVVPGERYKNGEVHEVPLTPKVCELLDALPTHDSDWLFSLTGHCPVNNFTRAKRRLDKTSGVTGWKLHDLRRTCRTGMGTMRVARDTAERVIGHSLGELDQVYDLGGHRDAKLEALLAWENRLMTVVGETSPLRLVSHAAAAA